MDPWQALTLELDRWQEAGRTATLWWRDDDAVAPTPALAKLLALTERAAAPVCLAVIPARAEPALAVALRGRAPVLVLPHGFAHLNHAGSGEKRSEFPADRPVGDALGELAAGLSRMLALFGPGCRPVLVPPWNRIAPGLVARLAAIGFAGLSAQGARKDPLAAPGLRQVNVHVDPLAWRSTRGFAGEAPVLGVLLRHLEARRTGRVDPAEPTGLLTHHLVQDAATWRFLDRLAALVGRHPAAAWSDLDAALGAGG